uniref:Variant surface glycoprotein 1125.2622 n=1 Tax=Trypanosoma brucei TaxID=5691 RepID=A0A1J0R8I7_9TRYP|nr:variant surface glycoprotein 1125.2622 [Trypanosoma brucei]
MSATAPFFSESGIRKLCAVAADMVNVEGIAHENIKELAKSLNAAQEAEVTLTAAAPAKTDDNESYVYAAAAANARRCATRATQQLSDIAGKALAATSVASKAAGYLSELAELLHTTSKQAGGTSIKCIVQDSGSTTTAAITIDKLGCPATTRATQTAKYVADLKSLKATGIETMTSDETLTESASNNNCAFLASDNNNKDSLWHDHGDTSQSLTVGHDMVKLAFSNTDTQSTATTTKLKDIGAAWTTSKSGRNDELFKTIGALITAAPVDCGDSKEAAIEKFLQPTATAEAFTGLFKPKPGKSPLEQAMELVASIANKSAPGHEDLKRRLDRVKIPKIEDGIAKAEELKNVKWETESTDRIIWSLHTLRCKTHTSQNCPKCDAKTTDTPTAAETDATCEKKGTGADCKAG